MNPEKFERALEAIGAYLAKRASVEAAVLYGSVARGLATPDSDLDLLLVLRDARAERPLFQALQGLGARHDVRVSVLCVDPSLSRLDRQMIDSILRHGRALKGEMPDATLRSLGLRPFRLIRYSTRGLSQVEKTRLNRLLFGYATRKRVGRKVYEASSPGLVERLKGRKAGAGAILVPEDGAPEVEALLRSRGAKRILIPIWAPEP